MPLTALGKDPAAAQRMGDTRRQATSLERYVGDVVLARSDTTGPRAARAAWASIRADLVSWVGRHPRRLSRWVDPESVLRY